MKVNRVVELPGYPMLDLIHVSSKKIGPDLMDYLMAPFGVQSMAPETWEEAWSLVELSLIHI